MTVESTLPGSEETLDQVDAMDLLVFLDSLVEREKMARMETMVHQDGQVRTEIQARKDTLETMSLVPKGSKERLAFQVLLVILDSLILSTHLKAGPFVAHEVTLLTKMVTKAIQAHQDYLEHQAFKGPKEFLVVEDQKETLVIREEE